MFGSKFAMPVVSASPASPMTLCDIDAPGFYAWWDPAGALARLPDGFPEVITVMPLYIGIAQKTLAERAGKIHLEKTRMSTIRRSLAALLVDELFLLPGIAVDIQRRTKFSLAPASAAQL